MLGVLSGMGEVNVVCNGLFFVVLCMLLKIVFVFLFRGVLNLLSWSLFSLKSGTGVLSRDDEDWMLYLFGCMFGVSGDMKLWDGVGWSGDICLVWRGDNVVAGSEFVEKKGESWTFSESRRVCSGDCFIDLFKFEYLFDKLLVCLNVWSGDFIIFVNLKFFIMRLFCNFLVVIVVVATVFRERVLDLEIFDVFVVLFCGSVGEGLLLLFL